MAAKVGQRVACDTEAARQLASPGGFILAVDGLVILARHDVENTGGGRELGPVTGVHLGDLGHRFADQAPATELPGQISNRWEAAIAFPDERPEHAQDGALATPWPTP